MTTSVNKALFVNQGPIGDGAVMGHVATEQALRLGMSDLPEVDSHFLRLPAWSRLERLAGTRVPGLAGRNRDLQVTRWHLVEAQRTRRMVNAELAGWSPDVIHVNSHVAAFGLGAVAARRPVFVAVDVTVADHEAINGRVWLGPSLALERRSFAAVAGVFAYNQRAAEAVAKVSASVPVQVLHPGIDLQLFRPAPRTDGPLRVLFVGAGFAAKGGPDLLTAVEPFLGAGVEVDLVTKDSPPVPDGVRVHHLQPGSAELVSLYRHADVFCLPSLHDANPWVIIEAMACALPVVASDVGSIPQLINDSRAGLSVPASRPDQLRDALAQVLRDDHLREDLSRRARAYAEEHYDARRQARRLIEAMGAARS